jgi:hypothetical protein
MIEGCMHLPVRNGSPIASVLSFPKFASFLIGQQRYTGLYESLSYRPLCLRQERQLVTHRKMR